MLVIAAIETVLGRLADQFGDRSRAGGGLGPAGARRTLGPCRGRSINGTTQRFLFDRVKKLASDAGHSRNRDGARPPGGSVRGSVASGRRPWAGRRAPDARPLPDRP